MEGLKARVARGLSTTFHSKYSRSIDLRDLFDPDVIGMLAGGRWVKVSRKPTTIVTLDRTIISASKLGTVAVDCQLSSSGARRLEREECQCPRDFLVRVAGLLGLSRASVCSRSSDTVRRTGVIKESHDVCFGADAEL